MGDENRSPTMGNQRRRSSISASTFGGLFNTRPGIAGLPVGNAASQPTPANPNSRRMSINTMGLSGTSPIQTSAYFGNRRGSVSTAGSESIDENAIEDDDTARSNPNTPFTRRMSFGAQALFNARNGQAGSPGSSGKKPPSSALSSISDAEKGTAVSASRQAQASTQSKPRTTSDFSSARSGEGLNWSEQFRSRAESISARPVFATNSASNSNNGNLTSSRVAPATSHERAKSVSDMPAPPTAQLPATPVKELSAMRRKPDVIGERILRGELHMD